MRRPPPFTQLPHYPVTGGITLLALGLTAVSLLGQLELAPLNADGYVQRGEVWRLLTSALPHVNLIHLAFNLLWLWNLGTLIEGAFGQVRTFLLIAFLALGSMGAEYAFWGSNARGLSGVVYGLWGFAAVLSHYRDPDFDGAVDSATNLTFVVWFFLCIGVTWAGIVRVANVAHGMGAVLGALAGLAVAAKPRALWWAMAGLLGGVCVFAAVGLRAWVNFSGDDHPEFQLGYDVEKRGEHAQAEHWYRRAVRINPKDSRAWYNLGLVYLELGRTRDAVGCFERAHELDPGTQKYRDALDFYRDQPNAATRPSTAES